MSSIDSSAADHAYFQAIEERFIELRGAPLLLSPADWQLARQWRQEGIPLDLVLEALEAVFAARQERGATGRVQGLRYCRAAVEKSWSERQELSATADRRPVETLDVGRRLRELSELLQGIGPAAADLEARVAALSGAPEVVEGELAKLDREMLERADEWLESAARLQLESSVEASIGPLRRRLEERELAETRERLWRQGVRRVLGLPILTLFES